MATQRSPSIGSRFRKTAPLPKAVLGIVLLMIASGSLPTLVQQTLLADAHIRPQNAEVVRSTGAIPRDRYKTWSLFLVCNPEWLAPERSEDLYRLYRQFQSFGRTIGDDHLAVWFWKSDDRPSDPALADNVDVERSVGFCKAYGLKPSAGPHLLVLSSYPDATKVSRDYAYFSLGSMSPSQVSSLLATLTDDLLIGGRVPSSTEAAPPRASPGLWIRLLEAAQQALGSFGCAWSFKVQTGALEADLRPCQNPK
jgi:hypothetical protein